MCPDENAMHDTAVAVLELLTKTDCALPVEVLHHNLPQHGADNVSKHTVLHVLCELETHEFVRIVPETGAYYEVTNRGVAALTDDEPHTEYDADDVATASRE